MRYNFSRYQKQIAAAEQQMNSPRSTTRKKQVYYKQFQPKPELPRLELPSIGNSALDHRPSKADKADEMTEDTLHRDKSKSPVESKSRPVSDMPAVPSSTRFG